MIKSIALIGGGGFIGTNLANFFKERNYKVLVIGRSTIDKKRFIPNEINTMVIDVNQTSKLIEGIYDYENVIWLVNNLLPSLKMDSLVDDFNLNINPLIKFLESCSDLKKIKKIVFISSGGTIYGDPIEEHFLKETSDTKPISAYGMSKIISENYIQYITRKASFDSYILRPSNVYGNFQNVNKPQGIIGHAFNAVVNNLVIELYGDGIVTRDFLHVFDLARAIECCLQVPFEGAKVEIYNVGSGKGIKIDELLNSIKQITNKEIKTLKKPLRDFDCIYNVLNTSKIYNSLGWRPIIDIEIGLKSVWDSIRDRKSLINLD